MSFDGLFTKAIAGELGRALTGGRINKIHQPFKNEIIMVVRANGANHRLLLSAHPSYARVQLTEELHGNPSEPPMFCMLLRKHIEGHILEDISQPGTDRILVFEIKGRNEIGDVSYKQLIVEIMGKHSNIILVDKSRGVILDSIKHVSFAVNTHRAVLPGQPYIAPPEQNKLDPFTATTEDVLKAVDFNSGKLDKQLVDAFSGVSPLFAKEVLFNAGLANRTNLPRTFLDMAGQIRDGKIEPAITSAGNKEAFYLFPLQHLKGEARIFPSLGEMLDRFYFGKAERDRVKQQAGDLDRFIANEKVKNEKKIEKLKKTLKDAERSEEYQKFGELLTANMHLAKRGMKEIEVLDYYDENGGNITIQLDPQKTPSENAQKYFSKYQKAKNAVLAVMEQIEKAENEVAYFDSLLQQLESASPRDIEEIREELGEGGYIRQRAKRNAKKPQNLKPVLDRYSSSDGTEILVGKNNKQNDYLTAKLAGRDEVWLHTKDIPGSHVVIRSKEPSDAAIREAAMLAAYFSKARDSASVPVDYTRVRHVKKPNGAKPGFVIYDNQKTIHVTPSEELVLSLKQN